MVSQRKSCVCFVSLLGLVAQASAQCCPSQGQVLTPADGIHTDSANSIAQFGTTALVSESNADGGQGRVYVLEQGPSGWLLADTLLASDRQIGDLFGLRVVLEGDRALIGARQEGNGGAGKAYVFERRGGSWTQEQILLPSDGQSADQFGGAVAIDGDTLFVGSALHDHVGSQTGAVYVFEQDQSGWRQVQELLPGDTTGGDWAFGGQLAASGGVLVVGAFYADSCGANGGQAYVFERTDSGWVETARLTASPDCIGDAVFGSGVAVEGDTVIVGAPQVQNDTGETTGAAYVFVKRNGAWERTQKLIGSGVTGADRFGQVVEIHGDTLLVSAIEDAQGGTVYMYTRGQDGTWNEYCAFRGSDTVAGDGFAFGLAIGDRDVLVNAPGRDAVYAFDFMHIAPAAPDIDRTSEPAPGLARIDWVQIPPGATTFNVMRSKWMNGAWTAPTVVGSVPATDLTYTDTPPDQGAYRYTLSARSTCELAPESEPSAPIGVKPAKPANLSATLLSGVVQLSWTDLSRFENKHTIQRQERIGGVWTNMTTIANLGGRNVTSYLDNPGPGQWRYRVRSSNVNGTEGYTAWRMITVP